MEWLPLHQFMTERLSDKRNRKKISSQHWAQNQPDDQFSFDPNISLWGAGRSGGGPQTPAPNRELIPVPSVSENLPPVEELLKTFQSIVDLTLCSICLETVSKDMVQCVNVHLICAGCKGSFKECPTCQEEFWRTVPSRFILQLLDALPPRCKHKNCVKYVNRSGDDEHEKYCGFRPTSCKLEGCLWTGPGQEIVCHMRDVHPNQMLYTSSHTVVVRNFDMKINHNQFDSYIFRNGVYLWQQITYDVEKKALVNYFHIVPRGKPNCDFIVELVATSEEMKCKFEIKLNPDPDVANDNAPFIYIPQYMLPYFVNEKKELKFEVLFSSRISSAKDK